MSRSYNPVPAETDPVWAFPVSLATTPGITFVFFSYGYLDVSVPHVRLPQYSGMARSSRAGLPHSDIRGSIRICQSPRLFAAYHVLHRLPEPRHPPCALVHFYFAVRCAPSCDDAAGYDKYTLASLISMDYLIAIGGKFALALAVMPHFNELFSFCFLLLFYFTMSKISFSIVPPFAPRGYPGNR